MLFCSRHKQNKQSKRDLSGYKPFAGRGHDRYRSIGDVVINKEKLFPLLKWITCGLLLSSVFILFLPYAKAGYMGLFNPIQMIQEFMKGTMNGSSYIFKIVMDFIVPVVFVFIAGLLLINKTRIAKCVIASILSIGALLLCTYYLTSDFFGGMHGNETVWFWLNFIIAIIGIMMPIALIIFSKITKKGQVI